MTSRTKKGTFAPGASGNPGGRSGKNKELREQLAQNAGDVAEVVMKAALGGDLQACRLVLERVVPALKPVAGTITFALDDTDLPTAARSILAAIASGSIPADQGKLLLDGVAGLSRVIEVAELQREMDELRSMLEERR